MASTATRLRVPWERARTHKCESRKFGYPTKAAALDGAELLMEKGRVDPGCHITPYLCDDCGDWHVYNRRIVDVRTT
jgi:hypothetical protein